MEDQWPRTHTVQGRADGEAWRAGPGGVGSSPGQVSEKGVPVTCGPWDGAFPATTRISEGAWDRGFLTRSPHRGETGCSWASAPLSGETLEVDEDAFRLVQTQVSLYLPPLGLFSPRRGDHGPPWGARHQWGATQRAGQSCGVSGEERGHIVLPEPPQAGAAMGRGVQDGQRLLKHQPRAGRWGVGPRKLPGLRWVGHQLACHPH